MGKNKQAQRTKNNARPSNSSRSAELLGTAMPNFVGFSAVKDGGYIPVLPGLTLCSLNDVEMTNVNSDFQIILKKMNKKDATTKFKALQEFATLCQTAELSAVEGMLPFWPRLYSVLAIDIDHKVREAAQIAHAAVVKRVGKGIAMYLKQVAGPWFTSQYDTYPPAASAATNSFNETFPQKKIVDAIVHCQHEILSYICDNITIQTPQSLSIHKSLSTEEMEAKYQKVLVASLQSYSYYFKKVPFQEVEKTITIHHKIISNSKFWKLAKHSALPIKTAFFNVLTSIIENADVLIQDEKKRTVTVIMNSLDETETSLSLAIWESVLVTINKIEDWYTVVSIEKLVLPKLWRILRSGGQCCASVVYPNLLPFLSQFPKLNVDNTLLYTTFFDNMRQGFSAKSVQLSRSEMIAVTVTFIECLRYAILLNVNNVTLCEKLLKEQLMPMIELYLTENMVMKQILFSKVTQLVRYWSKNRCNEEYKSYPLLLNQFWTELKLLYQNFINNMQTFDLTSLGNRSNSQIEFLLNLKNAPEQKRKNLRVKFSETTDQATETHCLTEKVEADIDTVFHSELRSFVYDFCVRCFNKINTDHFIEYTEYFNKLIIHFECEELFITLSKSLRSDITLFEFYTETLQNWLQQSSDKVKHVVELIFKFIKYINDTDKDKILRSLTEFEDINIIRSIIECSLSKSNRNDAVIQRWCLQPKVTSLLVDVAKEVASGNYIDLEKNTNLILLAFDLSEDDDPLISEDGANQIITILCDSIKQKDEISLVQLAKLIVHLVPLVWTYKKSISGAVQLLKTLCELCIHEYSNNNDSSLINDMQSVWKRGLYESRQKLPHSEFILFTKQIASIVWNEISNTHEADVKDLLVDIATDFLEAIINVTNINDPDTESKYGEEVLSTFLTESNISTWMAEVTGIVLYAEVVTGHLYVSSLNQKIRICHKSTCIDLTQNILVDDTENSLTWALFIIKLLNNFYIRSEKNNINENEISNQTVIPGFTEILINIILSATLGHIYVNHYKSTKYYKNVEKLLISIQSNLKKLQKYITKEEHEKILNYIEKYQHEYGSILPYIINTYFTDLCVKEDIVDYCKIYRNSILNENDSNSKEVYLQAVQIASQYLNSENIQISENDLLNALIVGRNILSTQTDTSIHANILERIASNQQQSSHFLLFDCDISNESWEIIALTLEIIRFFTELIKRIPTKLTFENWDFIVISLASWQSSVNKSKHAFNDFKVIALTVAVSQLFYEFQTLMYKHEMEPINELPPAMLEEWKAVFANDIHKSILQTWKLHAESYNEKMGILKPIIGLDYLGRIINLLYAKVLFKNESESVDNNHLDETIKLCIKLMQSPVPSIQLASYHCLKHVICELVEQDKVAMETECFHPLNLNIRHFESALLNLQYIVNTMLTDFKLCDTISCTIQPYTDSYTYTLGYLLLWAIVLDMCANTHGDLRYQYAEVLKKDLFPSLLNNIFRLMPVEVLQDNKNKAVKLIEIFSTVPSLNFGESWTEWRLDHIVCWLYTNTLRHLPVLVRQWWSTADSRVSVAVDRITTHYVSPMLCQEELLNNRLINVENMQIKVHLSVREVVALYQMDDTKLELSIVLPPNHPLGPVTVEPGQHAGGTANWRNCHMQLSIFLTHQNGSIWDGLISWKKNLDKKFAGIEECYICFSIFHISTYQIPKLSCHTCRKKFHTPCLYKWFSTSQKSTCPICRNVF